MDDLVDRIARALVPLLCGSQEDQHGRDLPDKQYDDLPPDWQDAHRRYAQATIDASGITRLTAERDAALAHAERLAGALGKAEEALVHLDEGALGFVEVPTGEDRDGCFIYPLRDELLGHIRAALASWQERG